MSPNSEVLHLGEHQTYASSMMDSVPQLGLYFEMRTGKTMCVLDWAYWSALRGDLKSLLITCPAQLVDNWSRAIDKMLQFDNGYTEEGINLLKSITHISSFQKLYHIKKTPIKHRDGNVEYKMTHPLREEVDQYWDAMVVDEAHQIGNHSSQNCKTCLLLSKLAKRRYILTGTPFSGGGGAEDFQKLYGQLKFLDNSVWENWTDFKNRYVLSFDHWGNPRKYRKDELMELVKKYAIVCRQSDIHDLPETTDDIIRCEFTERKAYKDFQNGNLAPYNMTVANSGSIYTKLLQLCNGDVITDDGVMKFKCGKDEALRTILSGTDDKVVIFCTHTAPIDRVYDICKTFGKTAIYDGRSKDDPSLEFQNGDTKYLVAQYVCGSTGIDLFASHTMVFYEPTTSAVLLEQAKARIWKPYSDRKCGYYFLVSKGTMEEKVVQNVINGMDCPVDLLNKWAKESI